MPESTQSGGAAAEVARSYFEAMASRDLDAMTSHYAPGAPVRIVGQQDLVVPGSYRAWFGELFAAFPDFGFEVLDLVADEERCAVRWRATGTFAGPGTFNGLEPTGGRVELEGCDVLLIREGRVQRNDAYLDGATLARQLGMLPPRHSTSEQRMTQAFNAKTRVGRRLAASEPEVVAEGVWVVRGGFPARTMNVYLVRDGDGVVVFDAGIKAMTSEIAAATAAMGGITRIVLGHAHADHRGAAPGLGAPVWCHPAEVADAEGDGGEHYMDYGKLYPVVRLAYPRLMRWWDGGPVRIAGTVEEGDEVAGFRVVHLPGHAPGLIALWRESDRLALASDSVYVVDPQTGRPVAPSVAHPAFNLDTEQARASIRKLASLEPAAVWTGHLDPITGDVRGQLERAAATT
jgi:steroid delta-isomerase-like uncharacterized protein